MVEKILWKEYKRMNEIFNDFCIFDLFHWKSLSEWIKENETQNKIFNFILHFKLIFPGF